METIAALVHAVRGERVIFDADLASLYGVTTKALNQAVKRNRSRFPADFMFRLSDVEWAKMRSQNVTSSASPNYAVTNRDRISQEASSSALCLYRAGRRDAFQRA